jgi:hypothetical protein
MAEQTGEIAKGALDAVSVGTVAGALMGWLPPIAALLTIIWTTIRIFETNTVQRLVNKFRK